ncbi:hypothetical protein E4K10_40205 [Streptomyces sp. T1317-0309]|nr:hypothetical protein E4K10_40205 [Streptomyces sp. T1317-0309]
MAGPLDVLVLNAWVMACPLERTKEGWELQFATNHLGHFALATGLHGALTEARGARVVVVSSVGHVNGDVLFDDINFEEHPYDPWGLQSVQDRECPLRRRGRPSLGSGPDQRERPQPRPHHHHPPRSPHRDIGNSPSSLRPHQHRRVLEEHRAGRCDIGAARGFAAGRGVTAVLRGLQRGRSAPAGLRRGAAHAVDPQSAARLWQLSIDMVKAAAPAA